MATIYNKIGNVEFVGKVKVDNSIYTTAQFKAGLNGIQHENISVLNKLSEENGELYYDGNPIEPQIDPSNLSLDNLTDISGQYNVAGGMALEGITYNTVTESGVEKGLIQVILAHSKSQNDRWVGLYKKTGTTYTEIANVKSTLQKGCFVYYGSNVSNGKYIYSMSDLLSQLSSAKSSNVALNFRLLNANGSYGASNTLTISNTVITAGLYVPVVGDDGSTTYISVDQGSSVYGVDNSSLDNENSDETFDSSIFSIGSTIYIRASSNDWTGLIENSYEIQSVVPMSMYSKIADCYEITATLTSDETFVSGKNYYTCMLNSNNQISAYTKKTVTVGDAVTANTYYEITGAKTSDTVFTDGKEYWTLSSNTYSKVNFDLFLIKLNKIISSNESTVTIDPGSLQNPLLAVIESPKRDYVSSVTGEYNASIGYDAFTFGNTNFTGGNYSITGGINNINNGDISFVFGTNNGNTAANSVIVGGSNTAGGDGNYIIGTGNKARGYYTVGFGCRNITTGVNVCTVGFSNEVLGSRTMAIGSRIITNEKSTDSIIVGSNIKCNAKKCFVVGCNGIIDAEYSGYFPSADAAVTMTAATFTASNYDTAGLHYKNSIQFVMGDGTTTQTGDPLTVMSYTKYRWEVNNAYFNATNTSSARSSMEPQIVIPDHRWTFTGKMFMNFSESTLKSGSTTDYECTIREGGRVKTCDPGKIINSGSGSIILDFNTAYKFKLKTGTSISLNLLNWSDGAEGYIAVYGGTTIEWPATWTWTNNVPTSVTNSAATAFALVKIMVIDNVVIATTIGNF